ncbi:hypothetical protein HF086_005395 [Spodoptera exigua]|uniref:CN hydrolase domain-containing protein n=1 Tax=Spodoptera exigua TaxID=7107 RepID=A0A922M2Q4_SPOEX|nr:hypothetical protein HF086_005395 [Spodoptera exigua]
MSTKKIAVCQMTSVGDKAANLEVVSDLISQAAKENVQMIFFPEACDYLCDNKNDTLNFAEPIIGGATVGKYKELAAKHNVWLSMGGIHEKDESNPSKVCNTHIIIDNKGTLVQAYRKLHLFDVEIPERNVRLKERFSEIIILLFRRNVYSLYSLSLRKDLLPCHSPSPPPSISGPPEIVEPDEPHYTFGHVKVPESCVFYKSKLTYAFVNLR